MFDYWRLEYELLFAIQIYFVFAKFLTEKKESFGKLKSLMIAKFTIDP